MITLVLGGTRSGKSEVAESLVHEARVRDAAPTPVTYVATGQVTDPDMAGRIVRHRARRPDDWATVEAGPDLAATLAGLAGHVLVDSSDVVAGHPDLDPTPWVVRRVKVVTPGDGRHRWSRGVGLGVSAAPPSPPVHRRPRDLTGPWRRVDRVLLGRPAGPALDRMPGPGCVPRSFLTIVGADRPTAGPGLVAPVGRSSAGVRSVWWWADELWPPLRPP